MQNGESGGAPDSETVLLHIFPSFSYGGQQARLAALARGLGDGFHHLIVSLDGDLAARALFDANANAAFSTYRMEKSGSISVTNILGLRKIIKSAQPDVLCTYNWGSIEAIIANNLGAKANHVHFEDGFGPDETLKKQFSKRMLVRRMLLHKSKVIVPSHGLADVAVINWGLKPAQILRIANGVDYEKLQGGIRGHNAAVVVGSLGALRPEKNYGRLIKAFIAADRDHRGLLELVGGGPERARLAAIADADARVTLLGATPTPADAYARFDVFALSSDTEQAPISLMEAMAAGLPVVATNVGEIADMVAGENLPFITPLGDDEAYAHALAQLLQNPTARAEIGAANRRKAKDTFSLEQMVSQYRALFASMAMRDD